MIQIHVYKSRKNTTLMFPVFKNLLLCKAMKDKPTFFSYFSSREVETGRAIFIMTEEEEIS